MPLLASPVADSASPLHPDPLDEVSVDLPSDRAADRRLCDGIVIPQRRGIHLVSTFLSKEKS